MRLLITFLALVTFLPLSGQRTTLLDKNGDRMRGTPIAIGRNNAMVATRAAVQDSDWWEGLDSLELNTVRLCWVGPWYDNRDFGPTWSVDETLQWIDVAVANATAAGKNLIINYHGLAEYQETRGFGRMTEFWSKAAPRYADNDLVYYELTNEQSFTGDDYLIPSFQDTMQRIYTMVHDAAPERHIILFSFNSLNLPLKRIIDDYDWVDYDYTTVGFHMYGWHQVNTSVGERNLNELVASDYPLICTEWDVRQSFDYVVRYFDQDVMAQPLERLGISWTDWRDWGDATLDEYTNTIIPDARAQDYWWGRSVSVREATAGLTVRAYPNPVGSLLTLEAPAGLEGAVQVVVHDATGRALINRLSRLIGGRLSLNVADLPRGAYTARLEGRGAWGVVRFIR